MTEDHITELETLRLMNTSLQVANARLALQLAEQNHAANMTQVRAAHGMTPTDVLNPDGSITRAQPPAEKPEPQPAPEPAPEITTTEEPEA